MILAMAADIVLRRNIRITYTAGPHRLAPTGFDSTTHGSHHVSLCNEINRQWNALAQQEHERGIEQEYPERTIMPDVASDETFGLGPEEKRKAGLIKKEEPEAETEELYYFDSRDGFDDETAEALADAVDGAGAVRLSLLAIWLSTLNCTFLRLS